jgi:hypothetical protein
MDLKFPLTIDSAGRVATVDTIDESAQRVKIVCHSQRGEWDFDISFGVPWREAMQQRPPDFGALRAAIVAQVMRQPGVDEIRRVELVEGPDRTLVSYVEVSVSGTVVGV